MTAEILQRLYVWDEPQNQSEIARDFEVEKSTISRLLAEARDQNLFSVKLNLPRIRELESELNRAYGIETVVEPIFQPPSKKKWARFNSLLAEAAARFLEGPDSPIESAKKIGLGCGATMRELVNSLTPGRFGKMSFSQLTVETLVDKIIDQSPFTIVSTIYGKWREGSSCYSLQPLPGTIRNKNGTYTAAYKKHRQRMIEEALKLDVAILGIGLCRVNAQDRFAAICKEAGIAQNDLKKWKAVGEVLNCPFDKDGKSLMEKGPSKLSQVVDSVGLDCLRGLIKEGKKVVAVAGGSQKVRVIQVALETGLVNCLVTDHDTAESLLQKKRGKDYSLSSMPMYLG